MDGKTSGESRIHHWHNAEDDGPLWRHGRAFLTIRNAGRITPHSRGVRQDLEFGTEWRALVKRSFGLGWRVKWGTNGSETTPDLSIHLSHLGDLWLHAGGLVPYRWLERHTAGGKVEYDSRVFAFTVDGRGFRWECWAKDGHWSRSDPWWMNQSREWERLFFGKTATEDEIVDSGATLVPMPEANYSATFKITRYEKSYVGPLGRLRDATLGKRSHFVTEIKPGNPVPVPGKGENSYDCGDDAIYSSSVGGRNVDAAVARLIESALRDRRLYGGQHLSVPA
jgi:hypothetical protein